MLKKISNKTFFAVILFISVLLCSFGGFEYDTAAYRNGSIPFNYDSYAAQTANPDEIISSEEISLSTSQAAVLRQMTTRKHGVGLFVINSPADCIRSKLYQVYLAFMSLSLNFSGGSQRIITRYIHDQDGQKA